MEKETAKKYNYSYVPGRTPEQLEEERFLESMNRSYSERFHIMTKLMRRGLMLKSARIKHKAL